MSCFSLNIALVAALVFSIVDGQICKTPSGEDGVCKPIKGCTSLMALEAKNATSEDQDLLKGQCGSEGDTLKVCCADPCYTPDGQPGKCVNIDSCPHLGNILNSTASKEDMAYVHNSKCISGDENSVCCGPPSDSPPPVKVGECKDSMSTFPPDPRSGCCGIDTVDPKMSSNETALHQHPWAVLIEHVMFGRTPNRLLCGGALISGKYALTSAQCVIGDVLKWFGKPKRVRLGEYNTQYDGPDCIPPYPIPDVQMFCTEGMQYIPIESTIPHPEYSLDSNIKIKKHDIALIRLKFMAPFTDFIRPICMPSVDITSTVDNLRLMVTGWGTEKSNVKLQLDLPYIKTEECKEIYNNLKTSNNLDHWRTQVCAGGEARRMACTTDVGGPLLYNNGRYCEMTGVASFGPSKCSTKGLPSIYTKVYEYNTWIRSNIKP